MINTNIKEKINIKNKDSTMSILNEVDVDIGLSFVAL